jgi:hypothetical protein
VLSTANADEPQVRMSVAASSALAMKDALARLDDLLV